ncbi:aminotransferase class I/II-fold pyridoxal phosphate-dependent enzyme [Exilibacterium tricleocarpae]|uniref:histidinol-phosphate transaminase n=1 Tax=Exilibacterium tricleocarpae TaxID=2591008 RepID=A0A545T2C3_9GAMM|nr:aminotransferase class I/II-fold pyridoxal phosphate-dependent enzyme [Exilibacterium tricleocarpae]TQV71353.1 aminotransferase class I/II-fold pyridoxal phosphate-dependent enzyme [Exilibacterium tricleocarpae]
MSSIFKPHITRMSAYAPPLEGRNPQQFTLLDFNERTIPVSEPIKQALVDFIRGDRLQMYPSYGDITERLADYCGVDAGQVMITNGSDQGIDLIVRAAAAAGDHAIIPGPSFAMYTQCAAVENLRVSEPGYTRSGGFPTAAVLASITEATRLIVIANPNNPSGTLVAREDILAVAAAAPQAAVLVDECYFEYTQATVADQLAAHENLVITRTFSKTWGLPSVRFGYVLSAADNIRALLNVRGPYDVNQLAIVAAQAALDNPAYTREYVREVMEQAKPLLEQYLDTAGIDYWPSGANYLWLFPQDVTVLSERLKEAGILVRPKADADGRPGLRVTIGTLDQTRQLVEVMKSTG